MSLLKWLSLIPALAILIGTPFINRAAPLIYGFPPILAWLVACVIGTSAIMALVYLADPANRTPGA